MNGPKVPLEAYPLCWPAGWKRHSSAQRKNGKFNKKEAVYREGRIAYSTSKNLSLNDAVVRTLETLQMMGIDRQDVIISTNVRTRLDGLPRSGERAPEDPGAAVYWRDRHNAPTRCMAIDRYTTVEDNVAAIAATLDAMRAIERHGGAEILDRAFTGFAALPSKTTQAWRQVLGLEGADSATPDLINKRFRELVRTHHPDVGGDREVYEAIVQARTDALEELS